MKFYKGLILSITSISMAVGLTACGATKQQSQSNGQKPITLSSSKNSGQSSKPSVQQNQSISKSNKQTSNDNSTQNQTSDNSNSNSKDINTLKNGYPLGTPAFSGTSVQRSKQPQSAPSAIPNGYSLTNNTSFAINQYAIIDSWSGMINNKKFLLDIYRNQKTKNIVIGDKYNDKTLLSESLPTKDISIYNFTGTNFVYVGKEYGGVNLINGKTISQGYAIRMSGCFPCTGGSQGSILGIKGKYSMKPVGDR